MVAIKDIKMPSGCQQCKFFNKHMFGDGLDYSYSCTLGATEFPYPWIRQLKERASDCPLAEIEEPKIVLYSGDGYSEGYMVYDMAECPNCGYKYEDGDKDWGENFCPHCGQPLKWESEDEE